MGLRKIIYLPRALADSAKVLLNNRLPFALRCQLWRASLRLKWQIAFLPQKPQVSISVGGTSFLLPNHFSSQWLLKEIYWEEVYLPAANLQQPIRLLDLGANAGLASSFFAAKYGLRKLVCVEPDPANFERLTSNLKNWGEWVTLLPVAVAPVAGTVLLDHSTRNPIQISSTTSATGHRVAAIGILELLEAGFDVVKMDIEGAEWPIIEHLCKHNAWARAGYWLMEWHGEQEQKGIVEMLMHFCVQNRYRLEKRKGVWHLQTRLF
jgi:FkbM family methyltransferase